MAALSRAAVGIGAPYPSFRTGTTKNALNFRRRRGTMHKMLATAFPGKCFSGHLEASRSPTQAVRYSSELKEVLATHGHRESPVRNPQFPIFHEADTNRSSKLIGIRVTADKNTRVTI
jgi:hypothetical protein